MNARCVIVLFFLLTATKVCVGQAEGYVTDDGYIALSFSAPVASHTLNLQSLGGYLVPVGGLLEPAPIGELDAVAAEPYTFLLANNETNVAYATIPGTNIALGPHDLVTSTMYTGPLDSCAEDLAGSTFGAGTGFVPLPFPFVCSVPEPSGSTFAVSAIGCLTLLRRRVRSAPC